MIELHFRAGDRDAANRAYEACRELLRRELGSAPSAETRALARRALVESPPEREKPRSAAPLPHPPTALLGREPDVARALALLAEPGVRLLTLTGPGGVGKTRLAIELARQVEASGQREVWFVGLSSVRDPQQVLPAIARALGVPEGTHASSQERLEDHLRERRGLLLLDNLEQVADAAFDLGALLSACAQIQLLVTSRVVLRLRGEHVYAVAPLGEGAGVALFQARAALRGRAEEERAVAELCRRLEGLPLAIELAAARTRTLSPSALLGRLDQRLSLLTAGARDLPARQQTLRATIEWSRDLLPAPERVAFRRLSAFSGGFTLEAFTAVCTDAGAAAGIEPIESLSTLVDHSLVTRDDRDRFGALETLRELASEDLDRSGERAAIERRHALYHAALVTRCTERITGAEQGAALDELEREHDNLRAALAASLRGDAGDRARGLAIAGWLAWFWHFRGHWREGRGWLERALAASPEAPDDVRGRAYYGAGLLAVAQEDFDEARERLDRALPLLPPGVDDDSRAHALGMRAIVQIYARKVTGVAPLLEESLALFRQLGSRFGEAITLLRQGIAALIEGDVARSIARCTQSEAAFRALGNDWGIAVALGNLAEARLAAGDAPAGLEAYRTSFEHLSRVGSDWYDALGAIGLSGMIDGAGDPLAATRLLASASQALAAARQHLPPLDLYFHDRNLASLRAQLDERAFAAAWAEGTATPLRDAVHAALSAA